jgi:hypothetical protein
MIIKTNISYRYKVYHRSVVKAIFIWHIGKYDLFDQAAVLLLPCQASLHWDPSKSDFMAPTGGGT